MEKTMEHAMETNIRRGYIGTCRDTITPIMENQCSAYYPQKIEITCKSWVEYEEDEIESTF